MAAFEFEVAACDADYVGEWQGLWEVCEILSRDSSSCTVRIQEDGAVCEGVPLRFVRVKQRIAKRVPWRCKVCTFQNSGAEDCCRVCQRGSRVDEVKLADVSKPKVARADSLRLVLEIPPGPPPECASSSGCKKSTDLNLNLNLNLNSRRRSSPITASKSPNRAKAAKRHLVEPRGGSSTMKKRRKREDGSKTVTCSGDRLVVACDQDTPASNPIRELVPTTPSASSASSQASSDTSNHSNTPLPPFIGSSPKRFPRPRALYTTPYHTIHEVAACDPNHVGLWQGEWEECRVLQHREKVCDVLILSDNTTCLSVPSRFVRSRDVPGHAPAQHEPDYFAQNRLLSVEGGTSRSSDAFPGGAGRASFLHFLQRLSDRNYTMRAFCMGDYDGNVEYGSFRSPRVKRRCVSWLVPSGYAIKDISHPEHTIVDTFHPDLCDPTVLGRSLLTKSNLLAAVKKRGRRLECLFVNRLEHEDCASAIRMAAAASANLRCLSIVESEISAKTLSAVASVGASLQGLILSNNHTSLTDEGSVHPPTDEAMAMLLTKLPQLKFLILENDATDVSRRTTSGICAEAASVSLGGRAGGSTLRKSRSTRRKRAAQKFAFFGDACWKMLGSKNCCPKLKVFWIDEVHPEWIRRPLSDNRIVHREMFLSRGGAMHSQLELFMLNPDCELQSLSV